MKRILGIVVLAVTLSGCQPQVIRPDPQDPRVEEILTRPGMDEAEMRAAFEKLYKLSEGAVTQIRDVDGKLELALKPPSEDAMESAMKKFSDDVAHDPTPSGLVGALIGALAVGGSVLARRQFLAGKQKSANGGPRKGGMSDGE